MIKMTLEGEGKVAAAVEQFVADAKVESARSLSEAARHIWNKWRVGA